MTTIKTILLFTGLMMLRLVANGQNLPYDPLVKENAHWEVGFYSTNNPIGAPYQMYQYVLRGDSILDGIEYKKLYYRDLDDVHPEYILSEELYGFLREDTLNRKIYAMIFNHLNETGCPNNEEYELFDFKIEVGDTTDICLIGTFGPFTIYEIIYQFLFGKDRKLYYSDLGYFIEGVGTSFGLLELGYFLKGNEPENKGAYYELLNYCIGTDEECGYLWVGMEDFENSYGFCIHPNPVMENRLSISIGKPINELTKIIIFDALGAEVYHTEYKNFISDLIIELPSGLVRSQSIFFLTIQVNNQPVFSQVIMIH